MTDNIRLADAQVERKLNLSLNKLEFTKRKIKLDSTPEVVAVGAHNKCNGRCIFCTHDNFPPFDFDVYKDFFERKIGRVIRNARHVSFVGFGEVLLLPKVEEFLDYLNDTIPEVVKQFTTNGTSLKHSVVEKLLTGRYTIRISLHASNRELHNKLTNLNAYDRIIEQLNYLVKIREQYKRRRFLHVELFNVLTMENIDDLPNIIKLAAEMDLPLVNCAYVTMYRPEHIPLSCFFDQDRTIEKMQEAEEVAQKYNISLHLPPKFKEKYDTNKAGAETCSDPWQYFYVEMQGSVLPCCYAGGHGGNLNNNEFEEIWNGDFYKKLRESIVNGPAHPWCQNCAKLKGFNVNNVLSHISNREDVRKNILAEVEKQGLL